MEPETMLGLLAGFLTTIGYVPQIVRALKTHSMDDFSLSMPLLLTVGMGLWLVYGIMLNDLPIILWNIIAMAFNAGLVMLKLSYSKPKPAP
jgi:MtN3 and saliva related transmembrane protein